LSGRPLILVFREDSEFSSTLRDHGFDVLDLPLITTRPVPDLSRFKTLLGSVDRFDCIFLTSSAAASVLADEVSRSHVDNIPTVFVLGMRSAELLGGRGIAVEYSETANTADELLDELGESTFDGKSILFIRGDKSLRTIPERLGKMAEIEEAVVYENVEMPAESGEISEMLNAGKVGWMCFFSPRSRCRPAENGGDRPDDGPKGTVAGF
jgi:uroporphyrinogen-III synthase